MNVRLLDGTVGRKETVTVWTEVVKKGRRQATLIFLYGGKNE